MSEAISDNKERLQKVLAARGVASRRACEELITAGRISVNGVIVTELGCKVDPAKDELALDGSPISAPPRLRYILLNKPAGYITSANDERGRRTVLDLLKGVEERVYPVGRLDYDTCGLLILTNDGELTNALLHPSYQVDKTYQALAEGQITERELERLRRGVRLSHKTFGFGTVEDINIARGMFSVRFAKLGLKTFSIESLQGDIFRIL